MFVVDLIILQISSLLCYAVIKFRGHTCYSNLHSWARYLVEYFQCNFNMVVNQHGPPVDISEPMIILSNHRAEGDPIVDLYLHKNVQQVSKNTVKYFMPLNSFFAGNDIIFIDRSAGRTAIYEKVLKQWQHEKRLDCPHDMPKFKNLHVYPEGRRNLTDTSLPLKDGFIQLAYIKKAPIMITITTNKEQILNLRHFQSNYGVTMTVAYSPLIHPNDYTSYTDFLSAVQYSWNETWNQAYHPDRFGLRVIPFHPVFNDKHESNSIQFYNIFIIVLIVTIAIVIVAMIS